MGGVWYLLEACMKPVMVVVVVVVFGGEAEGAC